MVTAVLVQAPDDAPTTTASVIRRAGGASWERVHVFISSTFNDMHAERDYLVKRVFPQLADWCEARRLRLVDVDLRWGVTEHDATRNRNVVRVCLQRIDDCRPFFVCLLGQRYGWVPRTNDVSPETLTAYPGLAEALQDGRSVTELEVLHAIGSPFGEAARARPAQAFFYVRHPSALRGMPAQPDQLRRIYTDAAEANPRSRWFLLQKRRHLRRVTIPGTGRPVSVYCARWSRAERTPELEIPLQCPAVIPENVDRWRDQWRQAGVAVIGVDVTEQPDEEIRARRFNETLTGGRLVDFSVGDSTLADRVINDLESAIAARFPGREPVVSREPLALELAQQSQFQFAAADGFVEREGDFQWLDAYVTGAGGTPLVLSAPAGAGKSMLLARWIDRLAASRRDESVHYRFVGASDESSTVHGLLTFLLRELQEVAGRIDRGPPADPAQLRQAWPELLAQAGNRGRTVLVIDGLDQLQGGLTDLTWIPRLLPAGVRVVVSLRADARGAVEALRRFGHAGAELAEVPPFADPDDRRRLVRAFLAQYLKELDEVHLEALISSRGATNPLVLKVVLAELRVFGAFANLGSRIRSEFGESPRSAFDAVLRRLESDPAYGEIEPAVAVPIVFGLLAQARRGLSAAELSSMTCTALGRDPRDLPSLQAAADAMHLILRQVRPFLARRTGRYDFFYESFRQAARGRYEAGHPSSGDAARPIEQWHETMASYFHGLPTWRPPGQDGQSRQPAERKVAELPFHLTMAGDGKRLGKVLSDLDFIEAKCTAGMTFDLVEDYRRLPASLRTPSLDQFADFVRAQSHVLVQWPSLTFQEAANTVAPEVGGGQSAPAKAAVFRQLTGLESRPWIRRLNPAPTTGAIRLTLSGHRGSVTGVVVSTDGERAVSLGADRTLRVWDVRTGSAMEVFRDIGETTPGLVGVPGTSLVATVGASGSIVLWDHELLQVAGEVAAPRFGVSCLAASADGTLLAAGTASTAAAPSGELEPSVVVHHLGRGSPLALSSVTQAVQAVALGPDNILLVASGPRIESIDLSSGRVVGRGTARGETVARLRVSPRGDLVASGAWGGRIELWRLPDLQPIASLSGHQGIAQDIVFSPDASELAVGGLDGSIKFWNAARLESVTTLRGNAGLVTGLAWSPDGNFVVSSCIDGMVRVWDPQHDRDFTAVSRQRMRESHAWRFADLEAERQAELFEHILHTMAGVRKHAMTVTAIVGYAGSRRAASASIDDTVRLWDLDSGRCEHVAEGHRHGVWDLAVSSDDRLLASSDRAGTIRISDATEGSEIASRSVLSGLPADTSGSVLSGVLTELQRPRISPLCFALRNTVLLSSASVDHTIRIWHATTLEPAGILEGHRARVRRIRAMRDDGQVLSSSDDGTLLKWEVATGRVLARGGSQAPVAGSRLGLFAVDGDGAVLLSGGDGTIRRLHPESLAVVEVIRPAGGTVRDLVAAGRRVAALVETPVGQRVEVWSRDRQAAGWTPLPSTATAVSLNEAGTTVAIASPDEGLVVTELDERRTVRRYPAAVTTCEFVGTRLIAGNDIGDIFLLEPG